jgi:circadian clock protein KaiC
MHRRCDACLHVQLPGRRPLFDWATGPYHSLNERGGWPVIEKISTGVEGLDRLTGGGFLRGSAYIIQGPPGAGKTILANQFCYAHIRDGGRALYMSLLAESSARMLSYVGQMAFFDQAVVPRQMEYISAYGVLEREGLPGLLKLIQHELKRYEATAMVLDGTFVAQSVASEQEFRSFIHTLQGVAGLANAVLVMLTHQARHAGSPEHTMVDGWIEMSNDIIGYRAVQTIQVRKHRGANILGGKHRMRISESGVEVFPRIESCIGDTPRALHPSTDVSTGLPDLDRLLGGGIPSESATLILGPSGSGKTTLGMYFAAQATPEAPALMLSFYESPARLRARARQLGFDLDRLADQNVLRLLWLAPADLIVDQVAHGIVQHAKAIGARRVFVDGIVALRDSLVFRDRLPYLINALSQQLCECGATLIYTQESAELDIDRAMPSDDLSAMVDNVIVLNISRRHHTSQRYISVVKVRDRHFVPRIQPFHIGEQGVLLGMENDSDSGQD